METPALEGPGPEWLQISYLLTLLGRPSSAPQTTMQTNIPGQCGV